MSDEAKKVEDVPVDGTKATTAERDELMQGIADRVIARGGTFNEARVKELIGEHLDELAGDAEFRRRMNWGPSPDQDMGGDYRGLDAGDVEFLGTLVDHPSDKLRNALAHAYKVTEAEADPAYRQVLRETRAGRRVDQGDTFGRAMDTAESGYGSQLIGAQYVGSLWEAARRTSRVWPLIQTFNMTAPTAYLPVEVDFPALLYVSESTANNSSNYTTSKTGSQRVTVSAVKFVLHQMWSGEMEEDSIVPFLPFLRMQATKALAWYQDALVLRGDTTTGASSNINDIDGTPNATDWFLAWDGIIHGAIVDNTNNARDAAGALTYEDFAEARKLMIDRTYYHNWGYPNSPQDLIWVAEPATAISASLLDEVITVDKYGSNATVLTGEIGNIGRNPLVACDSLTLTEATGKVDKTVSDNTKGQIVGFNRNGYVIGLRRALKVETERIPATDQTRIVYSMRWGFGRFTPTGAASGIEHVAHIYDITV